MDTEIVPHGQGTQVREECAHMGLELKMAEGEDEPGLHWDLALAVWQTILKCDDAKGVLKEKAKYARRREKARKDPNEWEIPLI